MRYFEILPKEFYNLSNSSSLNVVTNITSRVRLNEKLKTNSSSYYDYVVSEGETPEAVSNKIYGDPNRHWIILHMNDIIDPQFDWPLTEKELNKYIEKKYEVEANGSPVINWTQSNIKSYYRTETRINTVNQSTKYEVVEVDQATYSNIVPSQTLVTTQNGENINIIVDKRSLTYYTYESVMNDRKRNIKILKPEFVDNVEEELKGLYS